MTASNTPASSGDMPELSELISENTRIQVLIALTSKADVRGMGECWLWRGQMRGYYGTFNAHVHGHKYCVAAHRASLELFSGDPLGNLCALHSCDTPRCVNPNHLYRGSQKDNMRDCSSRGRTSGQKRTHCQRGHPLSGDNLAKYKLKGNSMRECLTCRVRRRKELDAKRRLARAAARQASGGLS